MKSYKRQPSLSGSMVVILVLINVVIAKYAFLHHTGWYWMLVISIPLLVMAVFRQRQLMG